VRFRLLPLARGTFLALPASWQDGILHPPDALLFLYKERCWSNGFLFRKKARPLRTGVELEGRPVKGFGKNVAGMEEPEFGVAEGGGGVFPPAQFVVEANPSAPG